MDTNAQRCGRIHRFILCDGFDDCDAGNLDCTMGIIVGGYADPPLRHAFDDPDADDLDWNACINVGEYADLPLDIHERIYSIVVRR